MSFSFRTVVFSSIVLAGLGASAGFCQVPASTFLIQEPTEHHLSAAQAKELFRSVDEIVHFASEDTKLPVKKTVKRRLTTRDEVEKYILEKFNEDESSKRMQRSEIVLKKFGLLDRDFQLRPFLVSLLKEQVAGFYDNKTKTVNLLDWIEPEAQKPVLAHELTHALQDQHSDLEKWGHRSSDGVAKNVTEDNQHLAHDEEDSTRDAVLEGQAMVVFLDYALRPTGKSLLTAPEVVDLMKDHMADTTGSPVLARAPMLLEESMIFPYREGLGFEQQILKDRGAQGAFSGVLENPPSTSFEILNPLAYEKGEKPRLLKLPDVHPILDAAYESYDVGAVGQLDVRIMTKLFGGDDASAQLTPAWEGGIYWAGQAKKAKAAGEKMSTASLALFYLSSWKSPEAAKAFARIYASELDKKYSGVKRDAQSSESAEEKVWQTNEGPVLIAVHGKQVFVSESFELETARKLDLLVSGAQPSDSDRIASESQKIPQELGMRWSEYFRRYGVMKFALSGFSSAGE